MPYFCHDPYGGTLSHRLSAQESDARHCRRLRKSDKKSPLATGRPTRAKAAELRERVIETATECFLDRGYDNTSLDLIALKAGVHRDTLFRQYGSKESLFQTVIGNLLQRMRSGVSKAIGRGGPPHKVLGRLARQNYADVWSPESVAANRMVVAASIRFSEIAAVAHEKWTTDLAPLIGYLHEQQDAGVLQLDDPAEAAYAFATAVSMPLRALLVPKLPDAAVRLHLNRTVTLFLTAWHYSGACN